VAADDPRGWRLGGAAAYVGLTLARLGIATRVLVGVDTAAAAASELDLLRSAGADLEPVRLARGPVFENVETPTGRHQRCISPSDPIPPSAMPGRWDDTPNVGAVALAPVAGEIEAGWASVPAASALVALGWQGLLRTLVAGRDVERRVPAAGPLLNRADLIAVSEDDLGPIVRPRDAVALIRPGATLVITRGERGGSVFTRALVGRSALRTYPASPRRSVVDPTGAGDVFLAALLATAIDGARLGVGSGWTARLRFAAAAAALVVEAPGLAGVPDLAAVRSRLAERG
jgi:sugar/nucleoside kinase (ribokinase family)